jgi:hypothetical protein
MYWKMIVEDCHMFKSLVASMHTKLKWTSHHQELEDHGHGCHGDMMEIWWCLRERYQC